jgi:hypothetical protein
MPRRLAPVWIVAAALLLAVPAAADLGYYGRSDVYRGDPTTAGTWNGSWVYVSRDQHWALWLREGAKGKVEAKLQYQAQGSPETFETDWTGTAEYYLAGSPVKFEFKLRKATADRLEGSWSWVASSPGSARIETADVTLYRAGYGRSLVLDFGENYQRIVRRGGKESKVTLPTAWGFTKVSQRHVLWDEMPW